MTPNPQEKICCRSEECLTTSPRVSKLLDPDIVQVMLAARDYDGQHHSAATTANCRLVKIEIEKAGR
jgi:hypothetical protein